MVANLYSQEKGKEPQQIPNLMDALVIYQSNSEEALRSFLETESYKNILNELPSNHISLLNRIL